MNRALKQSLSSLAEKTLPVELYTAEQVRALDRLAIETMPLEGFDLMKQAGKSAFRVLLRYWPHVKSLAIFCGGGNNGGDGLVIAGLAIQKGLSVQVIMLSKPESLTGEAAESWCWLQQLDDSNLTITPWQLSGSKNGLIEDKAIDEDRAIEGEVIIDCLLGTGLTGAVRADYAAAIDAINLSQKPVLAVDIPSGLCSDTGRRLGSAVKAQRTISFIGIKQGLLTGEAPSFVGELEFDSLGVPDSVFASTTPNCIRADWQDFKTQLPPREKTAHKGDYGRVLVIGGEHGMAGAALMAAEAVARVGAGLIYVATRPEHVSACIARCPELMVRGIDSTAHAESMIETADVIVVGPGLGQGSWGQSLFQKVLQSNKPMIVDADGLNMLAKQSVAARDNWILTPHPGEAARLLECSVETIERDRFKSVVALQKKYGGTVILKGSGTLIANDAMWLANTGNPGMASGGMGDVLSGILGGLLAQKAINSEVVAPTAVTLHGEAANLATLSVGEYSLLASDVLDAIPQLLKAI